MFHSEALAHLRGMDRRSRKVAIMLLLVGFVEDVVPLLADMGATISVAVFKGREGREGNSVGCTALAIIQ